MPRITIQQFRAMLSTAHGGGAAVRAYRELARSPGLVTAIHALGWVVWPDEPGKSGARA